jgi:hypothetical protein
LVDIEGVSTGIDSMRITKKKNGKIICYYIKLSVKQRMVKDNREDNLKKMNVLSKIE